MVLESGPMPGSSPAKADECLQAAAAPSRSQHLGNEERMRAAKKKIKNRSVLQNWQMQCRIRSCSSSMLPGLEFAGALMLALCLDWKSKGCLWMGEWGGLS